MEAILPIIIQLVSGAAAGGGIAAAVKQIAISKGLGAILGAVGGVGGGALAGMLGGDVGALAEGAASAGGLEALERFFASLPEKTGAAFIVIQHLSPDYESHMQELLQRRTSLVVQQAKHQQDIEEDHVYLIPPAKTMIVSQGKLLLTEKDKSSLTFPIDTFFRSLASEAQKSSVGVILSGTGTDGTLGITEIKEAGGLVLAQDLESARFDGMPSSATESGMVDLVLSPEEMPAVLMKFIEKNLAPQSLVENLPPAIPASALDSIFDILHERYSVDFSLYKPNTISRRLQRRLEVNKLDDLETYSQYLKDNPSEIESLYEDLLIGVTEFFRDPEAFEVLTRQAIGPLVAEVKEQIRVWVPGCASGEEAYTLAIIFREEFAKQGKELDLKIFASDVDASSIRKAAEGVYPEESFAHINVNIKEKYFSKTNNGWRVKSSIRQLIVFTEHNLMKAVPFTRLHLITCRNLLIYLQPSAQRRVFSFFHFGLRNGGYLMLGPSEALTHLEEEFSSVDKHWKLFRKRRDLRGAGVLSFDTKLPASLVENPLQTGPQGRTARTDHVESWPRHREESDLLVTYDHLLNHYMPPGVLVDERFRMVHVFAGGEAYLRIRAGRTSQTLTDLVRADIRSLVTTALQHAIKEGRSVSYSGVSGEEGPDQNENIKITVTPFYNDRTAETHYCVAFVTDGSDDLSPPPASEESNVDQNYQHTLVSELRLTRENLQATIEELETSNEELQAANEELVASNEELQSSNEELQSVNEELDAVNSEHQEKIIALAEVTSDLDNMLAATRIGVVFLDEEFRIRKFTPSVAEEFRFRVGDVGRSITEFQHPLRYPELLEDMRSVLHNERVIVRELNPGDDVVYELRIASYRSKKHSEGLILSVIDITSIEESRRHMEELTEIVDSSNDAIIGFSASGIITSWNRGAESLYGYTSQEAEGRSALELIVPESEAPQFMVELDQAISGELTRARQVSRRTRTGNLLTVTSRLSSATPLSSKKTMVSSIERDVTDDNVVRLERDRLASLFEVTSDFVCIVNSKGNVIYLNSAGKQLLGLSVTEDERKLHSDRFFDEKNLENLQKEVIPKLHEEGVWQGRLLLQHKAGGKIPTSAVLVKQPGRAGFPASYGAILRDVTAEESAMSRLIASEREASRIAATLSGVIKNFPEMLVIFDQKRHIEFISPDAHSFFRTYGESGLPLGLGALLEHCYSTGESYLPVDFKGIREITLLDGSQRSYLLRVTLLKSDKSDDDLVTGAVVIVQDVTEFRLLNDLKSGLIGTVSHELKNPVTSLSMSLELTLEKVLGPLNEQQEAVLEAAVSDCHRITNTITSLLDLARFEEGHQRLRYSDVTVREVLAETLLHNKPFAEAAAVRVSMESAEDLPQLRCDFDRTVICLDNLLSNAVKHSKEGDEIFLKAEADETPGLVLFSVADQGPGVPEEHIEGIFTKFFRLPDERVGGTGLGLNIAKEFVQAQGGKIGCYRNDRGGATFWFTLPVEPTDG